MKMDGFKDLIATVAPGVATALGGPLAGVATRMIAQKLTGSEAPDDVDFANAQTMLEAAGPDTLVKLKELELEFNAAMHEAGVELERIAAGDRDSARQRQVQMRDWSPTVLGILVITLFFGVLFYLLVNGLPEAGGEIMMMVIGALTTMTAQVGNYFFGSSAGSASKNTIIAQLKGVKSPFEGRFE